MTKKIVESHQQHQNIDEINFFNSLIFNKREDLNELLYDMIERIFNHFFHIINVQFKLNLIQKLNNDNSVLINFVFNNLLDFYNYTHSDV